MDPKPSLDIWLHIESGNFSILNHAVDKTYGLSAGWGKLLHVEKQEMQQNGLDNIMDNLKGFGVRDGAEGCELDGNPSLQRKFEKQHRLVGVSLVDKSVLHLHPMSKQRAGGHIGEPENVLSLKLPSNNDEFYGLLMEAFAVV